MFENENVLENDFKAKCVGGFYFVCFEYFLLIVDYKQAFNYIKLIYDLFVIKSVFVFLFLYFFRIESKLLKAFLNKLFVFLLILFAKMIFYTVFNY